jgi:hypothetical protein
VSIYGLDALRRLRERQEAGAENPAPPPSLLEEVPPDAPMDDAVITVWNGERFIAWEKWVATAPVDVAEPEQDRGAIPEGVNCIGADCGRARVWLVRDGERWLMFVGGRRAGNRRKDFASPFMEHAIRTAEAWYGTPAGGWRREEKRDGQGNDDTDKK